MEYQINETIPLTFRNIRDGSALTGATVHVIVYNLNGNSVLLSSTVCAEISPGVYNYNWSGSSSAVNCRAIYSDSTGDYDEYFTITEEESISEQVSGQTA